MTTEVPAMFGYCCTVRHETSEDDLTNDLHDSYHYQQEDEEEDEEAGSFSRGGVLGNCYSRRLSILSENKDKVGRNSCSSSEGDDGAWA